MKQASGKKNLKWLWLVLALAAVLAAVGVVLALVLPGQRDNAPTPEVNAELYWNVDRAVYTENAEVAGMSTRQPAQDGIFYIRFAYEGQQLELPVTDKQLVNYIDSMDVMGLVLDADGVVIDAVAPETVATKLASDFYVRQLKEGSAVLNSSIAMNGMDMEIAITEETAIYDVTPDAELVGQIGEMEIFDRVIAFGNEAGAVTHVYITAHPADADIYWRVERCLDAETGLSTREPDENGVYTIAFAHEGQLVDLKCKDVKVVNAIDLNGILAGQFALVFDEEGYIVDTVDVGMALRGTYFASDYHVTGLEGDTVSLTKLSPGNEQGSTKSVTLSQDCQIWQCCQFGCYDHNCGEIVSSLQLYDRVNVYTDLNGEAILIFVTRRMVDTPMFYNFEPQYGGVEKGSTRQKQGGYYVFQMLSDGKVVTVKTADKAIADAIDGRSNRCSGLVLEGDIITRAYDPSCVFGGVALGNRSPLSSMSGSVITVSDPYSGGSWNAVLSPDCKIYNAITGVYGKEPGGEMDLQVGDIVTTFRNYKDEIVLVFVTARPVQGAKVYYNLERQYNAELKQTKREPDASGYYVFLMACEGKQVTVKTQSKALATFIDSQNAPLVGMKVGKDGVVTAAYEVTIALQNATKTCNYHYVKNLDQKAGTFSTYYLEGGQKKDSSVAYQQMAKDCVVYNVSNAYENYRGEVAKLKDGDQIQAIMDVVSGEVIQIYIMNRDPIFGFKSYNAPCAHCGKTVTWEPYGGSVIVEKDTHYYACTDYLLRQGIIGKEDDGKVYDVVIDLKGKSVNGSGRAFLVYDKLTILDSVGGGKVAGLTPSGGTATSGSTIMVLGGGELNIMGGELTLSKKSTAYGSSGGVLFVGEKSVVNMSGGSITGGTSTDRGGNVYNGGTFNMTDGSITGGSAPVGGNIVSMAGSTLNISGGTVEGDVRVLTNAKVTLSGKTIIGGSGLMLPAGAVMSVAGLTKGASVVLDADGIFTEELTDAATYLTYFKPANEGDSIEVTGNTLSYIKKRVNYNTVNNGDLALTAGKAVCPVCDESVAWTALSGDQAVTLDGGHYYLSADITYTGSEAAFLTGPGTGKTACVHLNGHNITATANRAIEGKAGVLNVMGNGTVSGSYNAERLFGASVNMNGVDGVLNLIGGTYTKNEACNVSPVLLIRGGDVNMYSGAQILGANDTGRCPNVVVFNRSFNLYGGKISGGAGQQLQSNNWSATATAVTNIHGGEIVGTVAISGADTKHGGFHMDGGTITGYVNLSRFVDSVITGGTVNGTVNIDTAATNENSSVTLSDAPVITAGALVIPEGYKLTLGQLSQDAAIRVFATGIFTGELVDAQAAAERFFPRGTNDEILVEGNALSYNLVPKDPNAINNDPLSFTNGTNAVCPLCDSGEVTWTALSADAITLEGGKHYYLTGDITYAGSDAPYITGPGSGMMACVHLNGHNITATAHRAIEGKTGVLNIMGNGTVSGSYNDNRLFGATVNMNGVDGTLNLIGGTYTKAESCNVSPVLLIRAGDAALCGGAQILGVNDSGSCPNAVVFNRSFTMFGGKISGGAGQQLQVNNWSPTASGIANISGGEILGTVAISGAASKHGEFTMSGGRIEGYVNLSRFVDSVISGGTVDGTVNIDTAATNENSSVTLSGAPVITGSALVIPQGYKLTLEQLTADADITVRGNGIFTDVLENAENAMESFTPAEGYEILLQEGALVCRKKQIDPSDHNAMIQNGQKITADAKAMTFPANKTQSTQVCPVCDKAVTWKPLSGQLGAVSDGQHHHYYLTGKIVSQYQFITLTSGTVCLHMNGFDVDVESRLFITNGDLNIMGSDAITGLGTSGTQTGALTVGNNATVSLYGCTIASVAQSGTPAIRLMNGDKAVVNVYDGTFIGGEEGTCHGANVVLEKGCFNMYGGTVQNGTGYQYGGVARGGNIFLYAGTNVTMYAGTVTGGTANEGGNIYATGATVSLYEDAVISDGESVGAGGNVQMIESSTLTTSGTISGGHTTGASAHGGNVSMTSGCILNIGGGQISGGVAKGFGGNIRSWNGTITMTGGEIFGGDSQAGAQDNVWAAGSTVMTMLGGTVKGTNGAAVAGTAIQASQTAVLYLGGDATVTRDDGVAVGNIYIYGTASETAAVRVLSDWTGTASIRWSEVYAAGATVNADRGSCGTLADGVFTAGGTYTGTLSYELDQSCSITGEDGVLKIAAAQ